MVHAVQCTIHSTMHDTHSTVHDTCSTLHDIHRTLHNTTQNSAFITSENSAVVHIIAVSLKLYDTCQQCYDTHQDSAMIPCQYSDMIHVNSAMIHVSSLLHISGVFVQNQKCQHSSLLPVVCSSMCFCCLLYIILYIHPVYMYMMNIQCTMSCKLVRNTLKRTEQCTKCTQHAVCQTSLQ